MDIINRIDKNITFDLLMYKDPQLIETFHKQFETKKDSITKVFKNSTYFDWVEENNRSRIDSLKKIDAYDKFIDFIFKENIKILNKINTTKRHPSTTVTRIKNTMPFFMWIKDGEKAVVSFPNYKDNVENAIFTQDKELIKNFREIFFLIKEENYW